MRNVELKATEALENCLSRFVMREHIINQLRQEDDLSDTELEYAAKEFPEIIVHNMQQDSRTALAYVRAGNPVGRDTLPEKVWEDKEVVYQAFCNVRNLPIMAIRKLNDDIFERFLNEHTDDEISCFIRWQRHLPLVAQTYFEKKGILERAEKVNVLRDAFDSESLELDEDRDFILNTGFDDIDLTGDIELIPNKKNSLKNIETDNKDYDVTVYPRVFHYITDLHLTHKIKAKIEKGTSINNAVNQVIAKAVKDIEKSITQSRSEVHYDHSPHILLIGGDVSFNIKIAEAFYKALAESYAVKTSNIYAVLGNHELWDGDPCGKADHDCDQVIEKYRSLLSSYGITMLENQVAAVVSDRFGTEKYILDQSMLSNEQNRNLIDLLFSKSRYIICGGIGYSGYNNQFNADNGIYRNAIKTRDEEKRRTSAYECFFKDVLRLAKGKTIISLTHMPKEEWLENNDCGDCIFISGHTHRNYRSEENLRVYADNQIGYRLNKYATKCFAIDASYDVFLDYPDGIHKISRVDYSEFGRGIGLHLSFRHDPFSELYLLKRDGIYMFASSSKNGLSIMNGGQRKKLPKKDLEYYYSKLPQYVSLLKSCFGGYEEYLKSISNEVKRIGGSGRVHGCIVDIDFFHHIYVNPYDGKTTCYFAVDTSERMLFSDFTEMIKSSPAETETIQSIKKKYLQGDVGNGLVVRQDASPVKRTTGVSTGTYIYQPSRELNKIHKLFDYKVLQIWDDSLLQ